MPIPYFNDVSTSRTVSTPRQLQQLMDNKHFILFRGIMHDDDTGTSAEECIITQVLQMKNA